MSRRRKHNHEYAALGSRIRQLRKGRNWSQYEIAQHAGLSSSYLAELERGGRNPSLETILNIAAALDVNAGYLVDGLRYDPPKGLEDVAECWNALGEESRAIVVRLVKHLRQASK